MWIIRTDGYESPSLGRPPVNWERFACGQISHLARLTLARGPDPVWTVRARSADADVASPGTPSPLRRDWPPRRATWLREKGPEVGVVRATPRQSQDQQGLAERLGI